MPRGFVDDPEGDVADEEVSRKLDGFMSWGSSTGNSRFELAGAGLTDGKIGRG